MTEKTPLERFDEYVSACKTVRVLQSALDGLDAAAEGKLAATEAHIREKIFRTLEAAQNRVAVLEEDVRGLTVADLYPKPRV